MLTAITRHVSAGINRCELSHLARQAIDFEKAVKQHQAYEQALRELGVSVVSLPAEPDMPDSMFVEDPAVVVKEVAVITRMGVASRRCESESLAPALARFRPVRWLHEPATLEGGDVLRVDSTLFIGLSERTNADGIAQLAQELEPWGYYLRPVEVRGCLHLKSACCYLGDETIIANPDWFDATPFKKFKIVNVPAEEPRAANVLAIGKTVLLPAAFPRTAELLDELGWQVRPLDISELMKAEAGMTCSSILFDAGMR